MILPCTSPETVTPMAATSTTHAPLRAALRYIEASLSPWPSSPWPSSPWPSPPRARTRCHSATPTTNAAPVMYAAAMVCGKVTSWTSLVSTATTSVSSARPVSGLNSKPTGFCMKELAARMKYADSTVPMCTSHMQPACSLGGSRSQPKIHRPRNVDSRKNASRPSIASGAPNTSPTKRE